jgi:hypothetical protein
MIENRQQATEYIILIEEAPLDAFIGLFLKIAPVFPFHFY